MIDRAYIIDDDEISIFLTSTVLEAEKFARHIECYQFAPIALEKLIKVSDQLLPQVIFLDLNMPVLNGWDFLDTLTMQEGRYLGKCRIFILTSSIDTQEKELAKQYKLVSGFLQKPIDETELSRIKRIF